MQNYQGINILIVDDHALIRKGTEYAVKAGFSKSFIHSVSDPKEALRKFEDNKYAVMVTDIDMPGMNGIELTQKVLEIDPDCKVIILSMHSDVSHVQAAIDSGAKGYICKVDDENELIVAIKDVLEGKVYYGSKTSQMLVGGYFKNKNKRLAAKEIEVVKHIGDGLVYKEIADVMSISVRTVETYRKNILEKLEFSTNADIIKYAIKNGIME